MKVQVIVLCFVICEQIKRLFIPRIDHKQSLNIGTGRHNPFAKQKQANGNELPEAANKKWTNPNNSTKTLIIEKTFFLPCLENSQ